MEILHSEFGFRVSKDEADNVNFICIEKLRGSSMTCTPLTKEESEILFNQLKAIYEPVQQS